MEFDKLNRLKVLTKFDEALGRGLCVGAGSQNGQMCIEAAICYALNLPHGDNPECVDHAVRAFKIRLNDSQRWTSPASRAKHLRALGIAQIGSKGVVDSKEFSSRLVKSTIQKLIPVLFRELYPGRWVDLVNACEKEGTQAAARKLAAVDAADAAADDAAYAAAYAADAADAAAYAAAYAAAAAAAYAAAYAAAAAAAADAAKRRDHYLTLSASLALRALQEQGFGTDQTVEVTPKA